MELREFIAEALLSITQGVEDANKQIQRFELSGSKHEKGASGEIVEFDIALQVDKSSRQGASGKIGISAVGIGGQIEATSSSQNQHRLKFRVFVTESSQSNAV